MYCLVKIIFESARFVGINMTVNSSNWKNIYVSFERSAIVIGGWGQECIYIYITNTIFHCRITLLLKAKPLVLTAASYNISYIAGVLHKVILFAIQMLEKL